MKNNIAIKIWVYSLIILILFSADFQTLAQEKKTLAQEKKMISNAQRYYKDAVDAYKKKGWRVAAEHFKRSYWVKAHPLTAYFLSCTYVELDQPREAYIYATIALENKPSLAEAYKKGAQAIISWYEENEIYLKIDIRYGRESEKPYYKLKKELYPDPDKITLETEELAQVRRHVPSLYEIYIKSADLRWKFESFVRNHNKYLTKQFDECLETLINKYSKLSKEPIKKCEMRHDQALKKKCYQENINILIYWWCSALKSSLQGSRWPSESLESYGVLDFKPDYFNLSGLMQCS